MYRLSWGSWDGCFVGDDLSTSPKRHLCHTPTGFVTLIININQRCCQHHRLTRDIYLYCTRSRASSACEEADWKCYATNATMSFCCLNSIFTTFSPTKPDIFPRLWEEPRWDSPPVSNVTCDYFGIGVTLQRTYCSHHCFERALQVLEHEIFIFSCLFMGKTVRIEPAISLLFIILYPACDAISRK